MNDDLRIFPTPSELSEAFALELTGLIGESVKRKEKYTIALSGGNTPQLLFSVLAEKYTGSVDWTFVHFFWVDERCVSPDDPESNYGTAHRLLLNRIGIPDSCIHRIRGEEDPVKEAVRYSHEIQKLIRSGGSLPIFDQIVLGMGDDGHTASIFPGNIELFHSGKICEVSTHPVTGQKRVTITGGVINNADHITFLVTGQNKSGIIDDIFNKRQSADKYPAAHVVPLHGKLNWLLDEKAGSSLLKRERLKT